MTRHGVEAEELQAYLDRELSPARQAEVERHLGECRECAAVVEDLKRVSATLQRWQVEPAPASLRPPGIPVEKPRRSWVFGRPALALAGTAAVVLLLLAVGLPNLYRSKISVEQARRGPAPTVPVGQPEAPPPGREMARLPQPSAPPPPTDRAASAATQPPAAQVVPGEADAQEELYARKDLEKKSEPAEGVLGGRLEARSKVAPLAVDEAAPVAVANAARKAAVLRLIAYHVSLTLEVKEFERAKEKLRTAVEEAGGYIAQAIAAETPDQPQRADLVLRVPVDKLSGVLDALRALGRVTREQLATEEVTAQVVDLEARLRNARATEERLIAVLKERTGKVRDILEVEREIASTREDIERMEAHRQNLMRRVELATVEVTLLEEFQAQLQPAPVGTGTRLRNAFVEGYENFAATVLGFVFFFARNGLSLLFWGCLLWLSGRMVKRTVWRRLRPALD